MPLPEYSAALEDLYEAAGKPEEARKQAARLAVIERMDQAAGFPANRNLALAYADHGRNLDHALAMIREEMKTRRDIYEHDALAWVLYQSKQYAEAKAGQRQGAGTGYARARLLLSRRHDFARAWRSRRCAQASGARACAESEFRSETGRRLARAASERGDQMTAAAIAC